MVESFSLVVDASPIITYVNWQAECLLKEENANKTNAFSFLRSILISNESNLDYTDCRLSFSTLPSCLEIADIPLAFLEKSRKTLVNFFQIKLDAGFLYRLSESVLGHIEVNLVDKSGEVLASKTINIRLLPIGESASTNRLNEILASFVTPNDPLVGEVVKTASRILEEKTGSADFIGYQDGDPNTVLAQLDAIYMALQSSGINYIAPPASFEKTFQRIRLPREVLGQHQGTCIDLALLFASICEAIGLSPVLILYKKHCNLGVWLEEKEEYTLSEITNGQILLNAASKGFNSFCFIETANLVSGSGVNFPASMENAYVYMQKSGNCFEYALNISLCRLEKILPIPSPKKDEEGNVTFTFPTLKNRNYVLPTVDTSSRRYIDQNSLVPRERFSLWKDKLLDLNLKNSLVAFKFNKRTIQIASTDEEKLLEFLFKRNRFNLSSFEYDSDPSLSNSLILFNKSLFSEFFFAQLEKGILPCTSFSNIGEDLFKNIARKSASIIEESGCNPLFMTFGFIRWFENDTAAKRGIKANYAPLLLLPLSMKPRKNGSYYTISYDLDDLQLNRTFIEYLRRIFKIDFSSLNVLPLSKDGYPDLRLIYNEVRRLIEGQLNWSLLEDVSTISLFSFAHFAMWKDLLDHEKEMKKNPIVNALISGEKDETFLPLEVSSKDIEKNLDPKEMAVPLPADSSQLETVYAAMKGESFILDGPPGTGKSQTIANIIANSLYHGKKVLFVAEKEVALDVVKKRLNELNLGDYVLKIPNVSTPKSEVLSVIWKLLDVGPIQNDERFALTSEEVKKNRDYLNEVIELLHKPNGYFISTYQAIVGFLDKENYLSSWRFSDRYLHSLDLEKFSFTKQKLSELASFSISFGGFGESPFRIFRKKEYTLSYREESKEELTKLKPVVHELGQLSNRLLHKSKFLKESYKNVSTYVKLLDILAGEKEVWRDFLGDETFLSRDTALREYLLLREKIAKEKEFIFASFAPEVEYLDARALEKAYRSLTHLSFFKKLKVKHQIVHDLKTYARDKSTLKEPHLGQLITMLVTKKEDEEKLLHSDLYVRNVLGKMDYSSSVECRSRLEEYEATLLASKTIESFDIERKNSEKLLSYLRNIGEAAIHHNDLETLRLKLSTFEQSAKSLLERFEIDLFALGDKEDYFLHLENALATIIEQSGRLLEYTNLLALYNEVFSLISEQTFMESYHDGLIKDKDLLNTYLATIYYGILEGSLNDTKIASLSSESLKIKIDAYCQAMNNFQAFSKLEIIARVSKNYPKNAKDYASSSKPYQLQKIARNGGRGISLRNIFTDYADIIMNLTPCFLMSPMAVAQYLDFDTFSFDLVIFDEASQIPTHEAIGAIARAKSLVVAGDDKQMPPSSFFKSSIESGESNDLSPFEAASGDLESLLDDAITLGLPRHRLNWHYRSQYESLIAFSNSYFYGHTLWTFPAASKDRQSVSFRKLNGVYKRGAGTNSVEAEAIVKEIMRRRKNPELANQSIGVVTFNIAQQGLIENLLDKAFPDEDINFGGEPLFVKNLENVQGDERDVILFSITYGPDEKGRVYKNFGPLSQKGGERRLNVAVSRARKEMIVFSSMEPSDIDTTSVKNEGASFLRDFLRFAKGGVASLPIIVGNIYEEKNLNVGHFLAKELEKKGYKVQESVGASNFKVDVAILDEEKEGNYRLGILFDSPFQAEMTCQDRNLNEPLLLHKRKWKIINFLSSEYFDHKEEVIRKIERALTSIDKEEEKSALLKQPEIAILPASKENRPHKVSYEKAALQLMSKNWNNAISVLKNVIEIEGPISERLLKERYKDAFGIGRLGTIETKAFYSYLSQVDCIMKSTSEQTFYYPVSLDPDKYDTYRSRESDSSIMLNDIGYREIGNCAYDLLKEQGEISLEDLYRLILKEFGFNVLNEKAKSYLKKAIQWNILNRSLFYVNEQKHVLLR